MELEKIPDWVTFPEEDWEAINLIEAGIDSHGFNSWISKLRVKGNLDRVLKNIERFAKIRKTQYNDLPIITRVSGVYVNDSQNIEDMKLLKKRNGLSMSKGRFILGGSGVELSKYHPGTRHSTKSKALRQSLGIAESDFVVMALPLSDDTRGMFDAACFASMKSDALFINVGRGMTVDEKALYCALAEHRIGGAAPEPCLRGNALGDRDDRALRVATAPHGAPERGGCRPDEVASIGGDIGRRASHPKQPVARPERHRVVKRDGL